MKIIKNSAELSELVNEHKDLILPNEDVRIEFEPTRDEIRNIECGDLYLENDDERFNFNGSNFNGSNFNGSNFNGSNFNGDNFTGNNFTGDNFTGNNFTGDNFTGKKVSYWAFFNCYGSMTCESYKGRRTPHAEPVTLDGKITIIKPEDEDEKPEDEDEEVAKAIKLLEEKGRLKDGKILSA